MQLTHIKIDTTQYKTMFDLVLEVTELRKHPIVQKSAYKEQYLKGVYFALVNNYQSDKSIVKQSRTFNNAYSLLMEFKNNL